MLLYQGAGGISREMFLVRQGASKLPAKFFPIIPPNTVRGKPTVCVHGVRGASLFDGIQRGRDRETKKEKNKERERERERERESPITERPSTTFSGSCEIIDLMTKQSSSLGVVISPDHTLCEGKVW